MASKTIGKLTIGGISIGESQPDEILLLLGSKIKLEPKSIAGLLCVAVSGGRLLGATDEELREVFELFISVSQDFKEIMKTVKNQIN